ncbi:MAG: hypothetical protein IJB59_11445 [Oscillospiraceae bacterium]|nr:hypothetical protein [Oscillospiraceae bacterium]
MAARLSFAVVMEEMLILTRHIKKENYSAAILILLAELGVDFGSESCLQLRQTIQTKLLHPTWSYQEVYSAVGAEWDRGTVRSSIEINVRYVIEKAWSKRAEIDAWRIYMNEFGDKKPTNAEFIGKTVCIVELWQSCYEEENYAGGK